MASTSTPSPASAIRELISQLEAPVSDLPTLLPLLCAPLASFRLLPPRYTRYHTAPLPSGPGLLVVLYKHIPALQRALLSLVIPTWETALAEDGLLALVDLYFCPATPAADGTRGHQEDAVAAADQLALNAYATILTTPLHEYSVQLLARLADAYPLDRLHSAAFASSSSTKAVDGLAKARRTLVWEDCVRSVVSVPGKVGNAVAAKAVGRLPAELEHGRYFDGVAEAFERLLRALSSRSFQHHLPSLAFLLTKLANIGLFPPSPPVMPTQPSFFRTALPIIRVQLAAPTASAYVAIWRAVFSAIPSAQTMQRLLSSLLAHIDFIRSEDSLNGAPRVRARVKREAMLLRALFGSLGSNAGELWDALSLTMFGRDWDEGHARNIVCWVSGSDDDSLNTEAVESLLTKTLETWSSPDHIRHSLLSRHRYVTILLLLALSCLPPSSPRLRDLALSSALISGVGVYIAHLDPGVRRCGMLVAEVVAARAGRKLDFGDWDGMDTTRVWARSVRTLLEGRDLDADASEGLEEEAPSASDASTAADAPSDFEEGDKPTVTLANAPGYDSDDSLTGYASPTSSRAGSPTPSELDAIEHDPSLHVGRKKIARPVYLAQLGEMLRNTSGLKPTDENQEADTIELALGCAEELIRRKRDYGLELEENAVNLAYALIGLANNYELDGFDVKRQTTLTALVACSPRKAAPAIIEEYYKNQYSTDQRFVMLNALALGARELASLPVPAPTVHADRIAFPSKQLPGPLHRKYLTASDQLNAPVQNLLQDISRDAAASAHDASASRDEQFVRERRLRISKPTKVSELRPSLVARPTVPHTSPAARRTTFTDVAAEFFVCPLINRFWLFLRDDQSREARTSHLDGRARYRGAGTGLVLNALLLGHFLGSLAVLVHAAHHAPEWLAIVAPDALELAVTLGTRPVSRLDNDDDDEPTVPGAVPAPGDAESKEAGVLAAALELALVVVDGALELDGGRSLSLEHTALLLGAGEWAGKVLARLDKGQRVKGGGGAQEVRLSRAAAGLVIKVDEITTRWRRSMLDMA